MMSKFSITVAFYFAVVGQVAAQIFPNASLATLFISEVMEGSSFNKAIEIYNPTRFAVGLDLYTIGRVQNGGDTIEGTSDFPAGAIIDSGSVYTVCHPSINEAMLPRCDQLTGNVQHNGDDAIMLLEKNGQAVVDTFGAFGADPGSSWTVCGDTSATQDHTLVRKATVSAGQPNWLLQIGTDAATCEWIIMATNDFANGGQHTSVLPGPPHCAPQGWYVDYDGSVADGAYQTASGTLADCRSMCQNGTWTNCTGFSRFNNVWPTEVSACWWVDSPTSFLLDDGNSNEDLNIFETTRVPPGWTIKYDGSVGGTYRTARGTLLDCVSQCNNGTWADCVAFSRYINVADDDAAAACWWVSDVINIVEDDGNTNEHVCVSIPTVVTIHHRHPPSTAATTTLL